MNLSDPSQSLVINILLMAVAAIPVWKEIYDIEKSSSFLKKVKPAGWGFLFVAAVFILFNYYRDFSKEKYPTVQLHPKAIV